MKAIVLAGGFAKRLWPLTLNKAKPLLDIGGKPIINYVIEKLEGMDEIEEIFVSTNAKFDQAFRKWLDKYKFKKVRVVIEETRSEEEKLGAIGGITFVLEREKIDDDCLIVAGDNILGFEVSDFLDFYRGREAPVIALFDVKDLEKAKIYGIVGMDDNKKIVDFVEKPKEPKSTLASICCYVFPKNTIELFPEYLKSGNSKDAPGFFLQWLVKKKDVFGFVFSNYWFDIGSFESLEEARGFMNNAQST